MEAIKDGFHWFPDQRLANARALASHRNLALLSQSNISIPIGEDADALGTAVAGTALIDGYIPLPGRETVTPCVRGPNGFPALDPNGTPIPGQPRRQYQSALFRIRVITNFSVEPAGDEQTAEQRTVRSLTDQNGGLVNIEGSRFILGWTRDDYSAFLRAALGAGFHQIVAAPDEDPSYEALVYAAMQGIISIPVLQDDETIAAISISAEPYWRTLPQSVQPLFDDNESIVGSSFRLVAVTAGGYGLGVTYRVATSYPDAPRFSVEAILMR